MKNEEGGWGGRMLDFVDCEQSQVSKKFSEKNIVVSIRRGTLGFRRTVFNSRQFSLRRSGCS